MIRAIAIDDEPLALELIELFCSRVDYIRLDGVFTNTGTALRYLEKNPVDLLFLDIRMPQISGIDFYRSLSYKPLLILTTSHAAFALESYELSTIDYLLKPFSFDRFQMATQKARQNFELTQKARITPASRFLLLKLDYGLIKVKVQDILYVEALNNYLKLHLRQAPPIVVRLTLKALSEQLPPLDFIRIHRSFIVQVSAISAFKNKLIYIADTPLPVGKNFEDGLRKMLRSDN